jgi:hypothetical protein
MSGNIDRDGWVLRIGGVAAVVGAVLGMVGNLIHPATPIDDPEGVAREIAESGAWVAIHITIILGIALMLGGLVAIQRTIRDGLAGAFAWIGLVGAVSGATIGLILVALDGVAARQLATEWAEASGAERDIALGLVTANETINFALASLFNIMFAAITFILYGLAVAFSNEFPKWLGWVAVVAGLLSVAAGMIQAFVGEPTDASRILTIIGPTVITVWLLAMGTLVIQKARETPTRSVGIATKGAA